LSDYTKRHEEEITIRLQFEEKLNSLYALQRFTEERYARAIEEIDEGSLQIKEQVKVIDSQKHKIERYIPIHS